MIPNKIILKEANMLEKYIQYIYTLLIVSIVMIPSGWIYNINIRIILMVILIVALILLFFKQKYIMKNILQFTSILLLFLSLALIYSILHQQTNIEDIFSQFKRIFILVSIVIATYSLLSLNIIKLRDILIPLIFATFFYSFLKVIVVLFIYFGLIEYAYIDELLQQIFHYKIVGHWVIFMNITRMQLINDMIIPFSLFFLLNREIYKIEINKYMTIFISITFLVAIFVAYSRYIFFITIVVYLLTYTPSLKYKISIQSLFWIIILFLVIIFSLDNISHLIEDRFFSTYNTYSDDIRKEQFNALMYEFYKYPLFGKGMGGYSEIVIRSETLPFLYEMQWIALLMQFGIIGISIILILVILAINKLFTVFLLQFIYQKQIDKNMMSVLILYFLWLGASFTNPYLTSAIGGIIFAIFLALNKFDLNQKGYM